MIKKKLFQNILKIKFVVRTRAFVNLKIYWPSLLTFLLEEIKSNQFLLQLETEKRNHIKSINTVFPGIRSAVV